MKRPNRLWGVIGIVLGLGWSLQGCNRSAPVATQFQYQFALCTDRPDSGYWSQIEKGFVDSLPKLNARVRTYYPSPPQKEPPYGLLKTEVAALRGCAFDLPSDKTSEQIIYTLIEAGVPVICVGRDLPRSARLAVITTDYYEAGHKAAAFLASRTKAGKVIMAGDYPIPNAWVDLLDGVRHELNKNRTLRLYLMRTAQPEQLARRLRLVCRDPQLRGMFLLGSEALHTAVRVLQEQGKHKQVLLAGLSYNPQDKSLVDSGACQLLLRENLGKMGEKAAHLLWELAQAKPCPAERIDVPFEVYTAR